MLQQQRYLEKHFKANGGEVLKQEFAAPSPVNGAQVALQNLMVRYHTDRKRRLLICCHYDTRPFPDRDKQNPRGVFIGANDGGSGVALLCELGTAQRLGVREFVPQARHIIKDDHLPLNDIARIPTCDIIDFDYPNPNAGNVIWHTTRDTIENCSQDSLLKVGSVVLEWIREMQTIHTPPKREQ